MRTSADLISLASTLGTSLADVTALDRWVDEALINADALEWLVAVTLEEHGRGTARYDLPTTALRLLAAWYDDQQLASASAQQLDAVEPTWRDRLGTPYAFVTETEGDRQLRLYPKPDAQSGPLSFPSGLPFGVDLPQYAIALAHTETRSQVLDFLALPLALAMLTREFAREGRQRDPLFASACRRLADLLITWV